MQAVLRKESSTSSSSSFIGLRFCGGLIRESLARVRWAVGEVYRILLAEMSKRRGEEAISTDVMTLLSAKELRAKLLRKTKQRDLYSSLSFSLDYLPTRPPIDPSSVNKFSNYYLWACWLGAVWAGGLLTGFLWRITLMLLVSGSFSCLPYKDWWEGKKPSRAGLGSAIAHYWV